MPHRHRIKIYIENGHYHAYNRGVDKRTIFQDDQDYRVFLHLLKYYLSPETPENHPLKSASDVDIKRPRPLQNLGDEVSLLAYCLMPNHFHLLLKQKTKDGMQNLMRRLSTSYAMYFNRRNDRVGHLFQGTYKAVLIDDEAQLLHVSRYIHLNPTQLAKFLPLSPKSYNYSSYPYYLGQKQASWIKPNPVLSHFQDSRDHPNFNKFLSYQEFVEVNEDDPKETIGQLSLED